MHVSFEPYVDIAGARGSIPVTTTISFFGESMAYKTLQESRTSPQLRLVHDLHQSPGGRLGMPFLYIRQRRHGSMIRVCRQSSLPTSSLTPACRPQVAMLIQSLTRYLISPAACNMCAPSAQRVAPGGPFLKVLHFLHLYTEFLALFCKRGWVYPSTSYCKSKERVHVYSETYDLWDAAR